MSLRYDGEFAFSGVLHEIVIQTNPEQFTDTAAAEAAAAMSHQ